MLVRNVRIVIVCRSGLQLFYWFETLRNPVPSRGSWNALAAAQERVCSWIR